MRSYNGMAFVVDRAVRVFSKHAMSQFPPPRRSAPGRDGVIGEAHRAQVRSYASGAVVADRAVRVL
ncbi:hypothetical protein, partial [Xanthomonas arboricola]|uniref:hypothetical protein n=1 Tax=Xanthomonas arboricola TaxID=56448 RepID=UPI001E4131D8